MPHEYNVPQLARFPSAYEHFGILLRTFYQPYACEIMEELIKSRELTVTELRAKLGPKVPNFLISKSLTSLKNRKIIDKTGNLYTLTNPHFYSKLQGAAEQLISLLSGKPSRKVSCDDVRCVAEFFSHIFFDNTSNVLLHILLKKNLSFNEIVETFRSNHGYIPRAKLRYHLVYKKIRLCDFDVEFFKASDKKFSLSRKGRQIHELFDTFIVEYEMGIEDWIKKVWDQPIKNLVSEYVPLLYMSDPIHKVLAVLSNSRSVIVFSNGLEGIVTSKDVMNKIGDKLAKEGFILNTLVKDVMTPISKDQVLSSETTLAKIYTKNRGFSHTTYLVDTGRETYGILDLSNVIQKFNKI
jgi:CBS domain-containing protein